MTDNLKQQRDRFLAFSFATSDLLMEIAGDDKIAYTLGAAKGMTGIDDKDIVGTRWLDLFASADRPTLMSMKKKAVPGRRAGPYLVTISGTDGKEKKAVISGIKMPDSDQFYITLAFGSILMGKLGDSNRQIAEGELLDKQSFAEAAQEALSMARSMGQDVDMTLLDLSTDKDAIARLGEAGWNELKDSVGQLIRSQSIDGQTAAEIGDGQFSVVHDTGINSDDLREQISMIAKESDPTGEGIEVASKTVTADLENLSERDAARALFYTISEFERKGTDLTIESLNSGFKAYVSANAHKIKEFQNVIERLDFSLHFQPIVDLVTEEASHYEMLCRFDKGDTLEWVMFGEDVGLAPEFDMAVCERALNYIKYKGTSSTAKFAINLSGQSIEDEEFVTRLMKTLDGHEKIEDRVMFEITESTEIKDLEKVNDIVGRFHDKGFKVCLDDFGAGSASFQYLQALDVDYVKIDGKYTRKLMTSQRDVSLVKNLTNMCKDLDIKVVAEFVETQEEADLLREMGVDYAQGYFFGKAEPAPSYEPKKKQKS